jgi:hypothetical protein
LVIVSLAISTMGGSTKLKRLYIYNLVQTLQNSFN